MNIHHLPNVEMIRTHGERIVRGKIPREVRKELSEGVKLGLLGHLKKDGLKPEIYFHPDHLHTARERQKIEASYKIDCIKSVVC